MPCEDGENITDKRIYLYHDTVYTLYPLCTGVKQQPTMLLISSGVCAVLFLRPQPVKRFGAKRRRRPGTILFPGDHDYIYPRILFVVDEKYLPTLVFRSDIIRA